LTSGSLAVERFDITDTLETAAGTGDDAMVATGDDTRGASGNDVDTGVATGDDVVGGEGDLAVGDVG